MSYLVLSLHLFHRIRFKCLTLKSKIVSNKKSSKMVPRDKPNNKLRTGLDAYRPINKKTHINENVIQ